MKSIASISPLQLEDAFDQFNEVSRQLTSSYQGLESRVAQLNQALRSAQGERMRQLQEKERLAGRLQQLLEALPGGVLVLDGDGRIQEFNPVALDLLGAPLQGEAWSAVLARVADPAGSGGDVRLKDGRIISLSKCGLANEPGKILLLQDVTETRSLQELLHRHQRLSAMGEMAASLAHQLRTPLTSALLYTGHLNRPRIGQQERAEITGKIQDRLHHLEAMINDMLAFTRGATSDLGEVVLDEVLEDVRQTLKPQLQACKASLKLDGGTHGVVLQGNHQALVGVLLNLATNAMQARCQGLVMTLRVEQRPDRINLYLADNGPGIPGAMLKQVFTPFFSTRPEGTGLGLAVVRAVIEAHGGEVQVTSEPGKGAVFCLGLPLHTAPRHLSSGAGQARRSLPQRPLQDEHKNEVMA